MKDIAIEEKLTAAIHWMEKISDEQTGPDCAEEDRNGDAPMMKWTREELNKLGTADELQIASFRRDGTLRNPVTIWVVCHGDDLYVRSAYGRRAAWFRGAQMRNEGRIRAEGVKKDVIFLEVDPNLSDEINAAYRTKYRRHGATYVNMMVSPEARSATIKLAPHSASS